MKSTLVLLGLALPVALAAAPPAAAAAADAARGRYIVRVAGCNDCHTPAFAERQGEVPERDWLVGSDVGFQGPWGTSYPANLRLTAQDLTEDQWLARSRTPLLPPMPSPSLAAMTDEDLRAIYRYLRTLGPAGERAPAYVAPGAPVHTPVIVFVPQSPAVQAAR